MNHPPVLSPSDMRPEEIMSLYSQAHSQSFGVKSALARLATQKRTNDAGAHIAEQLWECKRILSKAGLHKVLLLIQKLSESEIARRPEWKSILEEIYDLPIAFRHPIAWMLFHAALQAERDFALDVCPAHSREDLLTGRFLEGLKGACLMWSSPAASYLNRIQNVLELGSIDLTVDGGEQTTGGDFAVILDIQENEPSTDESDPDFVALTGHSRGHIFVPLLFQAKCYTGQFADISRKHSTRGYQFNRLRQVVCASNYVFYENGKKTIKTPVLPMVKPVASCRPVEISRTTPVFEQSVDFATYLLRAINGFDAIPAAETREDALNMIMANVSADTVTRIAIIGNSSGLEMQYRKALEILQQEINSGISAQHAEIDTQNDDPWPKPKM